MNARPEIGSNSGPVPLLDLGAQHACLAAQLRAAIEEVVESQRFIMGPRVEYFEAALADYCRSALAYGVSSGSDALLVALMSLGVPSGAEVITSPYTFFATAGAISRVGARPVFVDIDPDTYNFDTRLLGGAVSDKTVGIIPVHLFGQMTEMDSLLAFAREHDFFVVEDAAQAIGSETDGRRAGSLGDIGCFSFFPSKNLGCLGDGGAVTTQDRTLGERLDILRNHGARPKYFHSLIGGNFRLDALQAAILLVKLPYLDSWTAQRQANAARYRRLFTEAGLASNPEGGGGAAALGEASVVLPYEVPGRRHIYNQFVLRVRNRDALRAFLQSRHVGCEVYYPVPLHLQQCFSYLGHKAGDFPEAELAAEQTLAIPIYPELTEHQAEQVVASISAFYRNEPS
ncbi:MAG: DegT/DnrJ/EryC1/StrS family aminotransferase [Armatimonadetes bacterium]|nr:DegT/DnrJ/EryC1/StrS family aminotransferase [Armatimonadota bacterium]